MAQEVVMPKLGQTVEEATIVKWHKKEGDTVKKGEVLFEIETDKAVLEAESFFDGVLIKILHGEDATVTVSLPVAYIGEKGEKAPDAPSAPPPAPPQEPVKKVETEAPAAPAPAPAPAVELSPAAPARVEPAIAPAPAQVPAKAGRLFISPRARALCIKSLVDPSSIRL
ncbi:MAG: biotin/lipoyl-containing protein [Nitrospinota bacterium]|nr:biotin/lipoyl-containing protein [Nitrospinota bacterium]